MDSQQGSPDGSDSETLYDGQGFPVVVDKPADGESVERHYDEKGFLITPEGGLEARGSATSFAHDAVRSGTFDAQAVPASASSTGPTISKSTSNPENAASRPTGFGTIAGAILVLLAGPVLL